ncbi:MAG: DUF1513 domain-containing protein [Pseudomonas marincola]
MEINRRHFMWAGVAAPFLVQPHLVAAKQAGKYVASVQQAGQNFAVIVDAGGALLLKEPLPERGHGAAVHTGRGRCVVFARRPDRFALVLNTNTNHVEQMFQCPADRHFYGHGFFSPDGQYLYATENNFNAERGVIGIYAALNNFERVAEIDCFGVGSHEAILMADGLTIAVANGGIATHPDYPRQKLNLATMKSSLIYINRMTGKFMGQVYLPPELQKLSIRHLVEGPNKTIFFGGQLQISDSELNGLIGFHRLGDGLKLVSLPYKFSSKMKHYTGSVAANRNKSMIAVTCPRGNQLLMIDAHTGKVTKKLKYPDVCGVAQKGSDFLASSGSGALHSSLGLDNAQFNWAWDNHLSFMP